MINIMRRSMDGYTYHSIALESVNDVSLSPYAPAEYMILLIPPSEIFMIYRK